MLSLTMSMAPWRRQMPTAAVASAAHAAKGAPFILSWIQPAPAAHSRETWSAWETPRPPA